MFQSGKKYWSSYVVDSFLEEEMMILMKTMKIKKSARTMVMKKSKI